MHLSATPLHNPAVLTRKVFDDEIVLVNADNGLSLALTNATAVLIWEMTNGRNSVRDMLDAVTRQFENVPSTAADDVLSLLDMLAEDGFIGVEWKGEQ